MKLVAIAPAIVLLALVAGCAADSSPNDDASVSSADLSGKKTDAAVRRALEAASKGLTYTSESDYPWTYVTAQRANATATGALSVDEVRTMFASYVDGDPDTDKPLAKLAFETRTFAEWTKDDASCATDAANDPDAVTACAGTQKMNGALETNLADTQVYLFGESGSDGIVEGTAVSILIVGRTPRGTWAGLRTIAIWT